MSAGTLNTCNERFCTFKRSAEERAQSNGLAAKKSSHMAMPSDQTSLCCDVRVPLDLRVSGAAHRHGVRPVPAGGTCYKGKHQELLELLLFKNISLAS